MYTMTGAAISRRSALKFLFATAGTLTLAHFGPFVTRALADGSVTNDLPDMSGFAKTPITTEKLGEGIYVVSGPGGNIGVFESSDGVLVIDSGLVERAQDFLDTFKTLTTKPLRTLINTHWHFDHVGGNEAFAKAGMRIVAQENVRTRVSTKQHIDFFGGDVPPLPASAWPVETFADSMTVYVNDDPIVVQHVPPAHTDGDSYIFYRKANVLHAGDLFFNGFYPFIDYSTGGSLEGMIGASDKILSVVDDQTKIIPGHGPVGNKQSLRATRDMLATVRDRLRPMIAAGKSLEEVIEAKPLADIEEKWGKGFFTSRQFVRVAYHSLKN